MLEEVHDYLKEYGFSENDIKAIEKNNDDIFFISLEELTDRMMYLDSKEIENISLNYSSITFVIGGTLGISNKILNQCDKKICFSKMTFPHQLIRVFLLEQIFRGFKISNGETYHR